MAGPAERYQALVAEGALARDPAQGAAVERLQALSEAVCAAERPRGLARFLPGLNGGGAAPRGLYLWGDVGRGKSLLMDIFFNNTPVGSKRRVHFHEFMAETHERIAAYRAAAEREKRAHPGRSRRSLDDPMPPVAHDIAREARLLCFDEFQVTDIADAMILGRLFDALFAEGVVMVATSNRHPDDLYTDGINRQLFLPAIALLKERLDIVNLDARRDYRLARLEGARVYHSPLGADADAAMDAAWDAVICGARERAETVKVKGREIEVRRAARDAARFTFDELCAKPLGPGDYLALARHYGTVFIDHVPRLGPENRNEARRFVTLIDALYEAGAKLVLSAAAPPDGLYPEGDGAFEFRRTASRLIEMQSADYLGAARPDRPAGE